MSSNASEPAPLAGHALTVPAGSLERALSARCATLPLGRFVGAAAMLLTVAGCFALSRPLPLGQTLALALPLAGLAAWGAWALRSTRRIAVAQALRQVVARAGSAQAARQVLMARLAKRAVLNGDLSRLLREAVEGLGASVEAGLSIVLELRPDGRSLVLRAGAGCAPGLVGVAELEASASTPAGAALLSGAPILVEDWATERRFQAPPLLRDHGMRSGMSVVIRGESRPYGVLGVHATEPRRFGLEDVGLLQSIADLLGTAIERHHAAEALRESEAQFQQMAEAIDQVFWMTTPDKSRMLYVSPAYERIWGRTRTSLYATPQSWLEAIHPDDRSRVAEAAYLSQATGAYDVEYRIVRPDASLRWVRDRAYPVRDPDGTVHRVVGVATDETSLHEAQQALQATEERFRHAQKMEAIGRLAGGIAHDFNNHLTVINGYGELLRASLDPAGEGHGRAVEIVKAGRRAASLTGQLLAFSRRQVLCPSVLDLNAVVRDVEAMLRRLIGESVALRVELEPALGPVRADVGQLQQVLMNLAVNARDAMPHGGQLTLRTANVELDTEGASRLGIARPGRHVALEVADTGTGMDAHTLAHLFEPFFTTKPKGQGTGLGLATVYGIVEQSGGRIFVASEPWRGTTFRVLLPRAEAMPSLPAREPTGGRPRGAGGGETVLVVEDEAAVRQLATSFLEKAGYTVLGAADASEALEVVRRRADPLHLLLTDLGLPGEGGAELAARARSLRPGLRVAFMTGHVSDPGVMLPTTDAAAPLVHKPYTCEGLLGAVRRALDAAAPGAGSSPHEDSPIR